MTICSSAFGKASAVESIRAVSQIYSPMSRWYSKSALATSTAKTAPYNGQKKHHKSDEFTSQRELFVNILNANATKRDAKQFLARFKLPGEKPTSLSSKSNQDQAAGRQNQHDHSQKLGVNLGGLYSPGRAIAEAPQFVRQEMAEQTMPKDVMSTALVCLRTPEKLEEDTLDGLALTLSQLVKLDMHIVVVIGDGRVNGNTAENNISLKLNVDRQARRLCEAIEKHNQAAARYVDGALEVDKKPNGEATNLRVAVPRLVLGPLRQSTITIVSSFAYTTIGELVTIKTADTMSTLTEYLSSNSKNASAVDSSDIEASEISVDRIIVLDEAGGIPSKARRDGAHVFINLRQEYSSILDELSEYASCNRVGPGHYPGRSTVYDRQQDNLRLLQRCLAKLSSASSAIIISPQEAAASSGFLRRPRGSETGAGTRRQKNPLIHNLLTNKPMISSSLPVARLPNTSAARSNGDSHLAWQAPTLVKRGMPLEIIPNPHRGNRWEESGWMSPRDGFTTLELDKDPRIDFPRLLHLIEDSFRKKLNVEHYLNRIKGKVAGVIVAGNYEGGAILTWEQPPGTSDPLRLVPYLDKFAVLQSSQGSSGVADILFQSMVRSCFPNGVCWRSRKDNPVNKWYFERASASWQIPESMWTMFWTGEGVVENGDRFEDYLGVCKTVIPSFYSKNQE
ncbi:amino-acid acetyltransferase, mitochondrial [Acrodontium crateriforme]|uniref:Amino-acid acetyltransferase, mitochondrial n=1 Tax=Acrodontium crateriforme TaxID=150365 RepID=A0AAQ3R916_9PEZI|nr:amino-acid acetyltransferase, mitochondrial [Acrodontium crateriforme]